MPLHTLFDPHTLLGQKIGDYELREVLGTGNSAVYRAYDPGKNELVALKLVRWPGAHIEQATLKRFKREIELLRKRRHRHIIDIYDWRTSGDYVFLVMEACDGTLADWMEHHKPTLSEALTILEPLAEAIDFLHVPPDMVLHRDIKPQNILFKGDTWYISDFSIARGEADQNITLSGQAVGTLRYAAPEQILGGKLTPETDIYSFGLVVFELLAGGWVFAERDSSDWNYLVPDLSRYNPQITRDVTVLFKRWLADDPSQRPKRAVSAIRELGALAGILRDPMLARLYDLAGELSSQPRDPDSWNDALALLDVIRGYEPRFTDPRGTEAIVRRRLDGMEPGPAPVGYTGKPAEFYSETTLDGVHTTLPLEERSAEGPRKTLQPPAAPHEDFVPRSRYECDAELHVPAEIGVGGSVFGRAIVVEDTALVAGDVYSLGDVTIGTNAEVGGVIVAGGMVTLGPGARVNGYAGVQAGALRLEEGARVEGWAGSLREALLSPGSDVEGILAGGPLVLAEESRSFSPSAGSVGGEVQLEEGAILADMPVGPGFVHAWAAQPSGDGVLGAKGHIASALMSAELQALTQAVLRDAGPPPGLPAPSFGRAAKPVAPKLPPRILPPGAPVTAELSDDDAAPGPSIPPASPTALEVGLLDGGPALYRASVIRVAGEGDPQELPGEPERAVAAAWLIDRAWTDYTVRLRLPAIIVAAAALVVLILSLLLGSVLPALAWLLFAGVGAAIAWSLRPRPLALAKVYWAWHSFAGAEGALLWDTRRQESESTYPDLQADPAKLIPMADAVGSTHDDVALLSTMHKLSQSLIGLNWQVWPGIFDLSGDAAGQGAATAIMGLDLQRGLPSEIARLPVLRPVVAVEQARAAAAWLRGWPADGAKQRRAIGEIAGRMKAVNNHAALWNAAREESQRRTVALKKAWDVQRNRATELAEKTFAALDAEIEPDATRAWGNHESSAQLIGDHFGAHRQHLGGQFAGAKAAAEAQLRHEQDELERQEAALRKVETELEPLPRRWREEGSKHEQARSALQDQWERVRAALTRQESQGQDPFVRPRPMDQRTATQLLTQLADAATPLERQLEGLQGETASAERSLGATLPWPQWPATIGDSTDAGMVARELNAFARRLRSEAAATRTRLENATNLRDGAAYALEGALGALEALDGSLSTQEQRDDATTEPDISRLRNQRGRADSAARALRKVVNGANRLQRRLQAAEVAYNEFAETLAVAVKEGRAGRPWEEARQIRTDYERMTLARETAIAARDEARAALDRARAELSRQGDQETREMQRLAGLEQTLVRRSHTVASRDERQLRRHIEELRGRHEAVLTAMRRRDAWPDALGRFEAGCFDTRVSALEHLRGRIAIICDGTLQRLALTEQRRSAALWPAANWPGGETRYLVPVWLLLYRPGGSRSHERLVALTPADMAPVARRVALRPAAGFELTENPTLAALFAAEVLAPITDQRLDRIPGALNMLDPAHRAGLIKAWQALAADKWLPGWLKRAL